MCVIVTFPNIYPSHVFDRVIADKKFKEIVWQEICWNIFPFAQLAHVLTFHITALIPFKTSPSKKLIEGKYAN